MKTIEDDLVHKTVSELFDIVKSQQAKIDELQERIDNALEAMDAESANSWGIWKEKACMYEQGASNAYERSYWILKGESDDRTRN